MGSPGVIDMPSARMQTDGQLTIGGGFFENTQHYNFDFQALPWLEASLRYSGLQHFDPLFPVYFDRSFALKARLWNEGRVLPTVAVGVDDMVGTGIYAGEYVVASKQVGPLDFTLGMGWGRLGTAGTVPNPLRLLSSSFDRSRDFGAAGAANFSALFHGHNAGIFGGMNWQTPVTGLTLSAEYSSDAYKAEAARNNFIPRSQFNLGGSYQLLDNTQFGLYWLYGRSIGGTFSFSLDPVHDPFPERLGPELPPITSRSNEEQQHALNRFTGRDVVQVHVDHGALVDALWNSPVAVESVSMKGRVLSVNVARGDPRNVCAALSKIVAAMSFDVTDLEISSGPATASCRLPDRLKAEPAVLVDDTQTPHVMLAFQGVSTIDAQRRAPLSPAQAQARIRKDLIIQQIHVEALSLSGSEAVLYYSNFTYQKERQALDRIVRVLMADAPPDVEKFRLIPTVNGTPQREFDVLRAPLERAFGQTDTLDVLADPTTAGPAPMRNPVLAAASRSLYPRFDWSVFPQFRQQLFDPTNPFAVQFLGAGSVQVDLTRGLSLLAEGEVDIYDNFNTLRPPGSVLPHVRTDFVKFFSQGKNGIGDLEMDYRFRLAPGVFAVARAGYLESMFAGVGGEVLWRPDGQRWALGIDAYEVKERDFDRLFGLQPYHVFTGHVSLYYASPWYDLNFALRAGRYLAGDRGLTVEMTRRFDSGVEIGAFFTKTNVSAQDFGEGSFDKGIIIRFPLGWVAPLNTQNQFALDLRPVQRDGGQRLLNDASLYEETRRTSQAEMFGAAPPG
jgi:hypothetical protein